MPITKSGHDIGMKITLEWKTESIMESEFVPAAGQKVKNVNINVTYAATYALNMTVEGADNAIGDKNNGTITWSGSLDKFVATAYEGQVRIKDISVVVGE